MSMTFQDIEEALKTADGKGFKPNLLLVPPKVYKALLNDSKFKKDKNEKEKVQFT